MWNVATGVEVSSVDETAFVESRTQGAASRLIGSLTAKHRTIAAVVTASVGVFLVMNLASTGDSSSANSNQDQTEVPDNAASRPREKSEAADKSVGETAIAMDSVGEPLPVDASLQIAGQTEGDHADSAEHTGNNSSLPPDGLGANPGLDAGKLIAADGDSPGSNPEASTVAQLVFDGEKESQTGRSQESRGPQPKAPTPKPMSVLDRLGFSIESFRQPKPVPLRDLIRTVEQMCRVHVDITGAPPDSLSAEITLSLKDTTPADILSEAGRKTGLRVIVDESSVRMIPQND